MSTEKTETTVATETKVGRIIGVQHRMKKTKEGEARPTILWIEDLLPSGEKSSVKLELADDLAELDWVYGKLPSAWRSVEVGENLFGLERHHIHFRDPQDNESYESVLAVWPEASLNIEVKNRGRKNERQTLLGVPTEVASEFAGMKAGDVILGIFGGSGHKPVVALINKATELGARVLLTSPHNLKKVREEAMVSKDDDAQTLVEMYRTKPEFFHEVFQTDVVTWNVLQSWDLTEEAMSQRLKLIQRAEARASYELYASRRYVGSQYAQKVLDAKMGDTTVRDVIQSETEAQKKLEETIEAHPLYQRLFVDVKGVGPRFCGKLISAVRDIRRFPREGIGAFLLFTGQATVLVNGKHTIQRFRRGKEGEDNPTPGNSEIRQAVWLLVDIQMSRQKETTPWGQRFQEIKAKLREAHPFPELVCDTEIPLVDGKYECKENGDCNVVFGKGKEHLFRGASQGGAKKVLVIPPETILLKGEWKTANGLCEFTLPDGSKDFRPGTTRYTKIHIHKIAKRKLATEFMVWVFREWWKFVDEQEAQRKASAKAQVGS